MKCCCSQKEFPWAVNLLTALLYHSQPCARARAGKNSASYETLIICLEEMGAWVQRGIWHLHSLALVQ